MNKQKVENIVKRHDFSEKVITFRESIPKKSSFPLQKFPPVPPLPPVPQAWWWNIANLQALIRQLTSYLLPVSKRSFASKHKDKTTPLDTSQHYPIMTSRQYPIYIPHRRAVQIFSHCSFIQPTFHSPFNQFS